MVWCHSANDWCWRVPRQSTTYPLCLSATHPEWVSKGLTSHSTHNWIFYGRFHRLDDPTNSDKALKPANTPNYTCSNYKIPFSICTPSASVRISDSRVRGPKLEGWVIIRKQIATNQYQHAPPYHRLHNAIGSKNPLVRLASNCKSCLQPHSLSLKRLV